MNISAICSRRRCLKHLSETTHLSWARSKPRLTLRLFNLTSHSGMTETPKYEERNVRAALEVEEESRSTQLKVANREIPGIGSIRITAGQSSRTYLTILLFLLAFNWFAGTCVYYGFTFTLRFLKGDLFIFGMAIGAAETLGDICSFLLA